VLGRFELAVDARIDAALTLAQSHYAGAQRCVASLIALAIAVAVGFWMRTTQPHFLLKSVLVGIAAVPLAPIAKDLVSALQAATTALRTKP
jgi:ethanolamine transporter EutH